MFSYWFSKSSQRYVLCGIFVAMGIVSMILLLALDQIRLTERRKRFALSKGMMKKWYFVEPPLQSLKKSFDVIRSFFRWQHMDQLFLIPITMWTMIESSFIVAQYTQVKSLLDKRSGCLCFILGIYYVSHWHSVRIWHAIRFCWIESDLDILVLFLLLVEYVLQYLVMSSVV